MTTSNNTKNQGTTNNVPRGTLTNIQKDIEQINQAGYTAFNNEIKFHLASAITGLKKQLTNLSNNYRKLNRPKELISKTNKALDLITDIHINEIAGYSITTDPAVGVINNIFHKIKDILQDIYRNNEHTTKQKNELELIYNNISYPARILNLIK